MSTNFVRKEIFLKRSTFENIVLLSKCTGWTFNETVEHLLHAVTSDNEELELNEMYAVICRRFGESLD